MNYFIKSAGTAQEPPPANWYMWGRNERGTFADPTMFPRNPRIEPGDRLVFYAVGSAAQFKFGRIFAVTEVMSEPEPSDNDRWPWQVTTRMLVPGPRLPSCPHLDYIDVEQISLRRASHIAITPEQGATAERWIARRAREAGSAGHCYNGPPPPADFEPGQ